MSYSLTESASRFWGLGGLVGKLGGYNAGATNINQGGATQVFNGAASPTSDPTLSSAVTATIAYLDFGANMYGAGIWQLRVTGQPSINGVVLCLIGDTATNFTTAPVNMGSFVIPSDNLTKDFVGYFSADPGSFRYVRVENRGVAIGGSTLTLNVEVVATP